jgi:hypothetical protein
MDPHPLFREFIKASLNYGKKKHNPLKGKGHGKKTKSNEKPILN